MKGIRDLRWFMFYFYYVLYIEMRLQMKEDSIFEFLVQFGFFWFFLMLYNVILYVVFLFQGFSVVLKGRLKNSNRREVKGEILGGNKFIRKNK